MKIAVAYTIRLASSAFYKCKLRMSGLYFQYFVHSALEITSASDTIGMTEQRHRPRGMIGFVRHHRQIFGLLATLAICCVCLYVGLHMLGESRAITDDALKNRMRERFPTFVPPHVFSSMTMSVGRYSSVDEVPHRMICECKPLGPDEFELGAVQLRHDTTEPVSGTPSYLVTIANVISVNEYLLRNSDSRVRFVMPKMWNSSVVADRQLLETLDFNPCVITLRLDHEKIIHMINPIERTSGAPSSSGDVKIREKIFVYPFMSSLQHASEDESDMIVQRRSNVTIRYREWPTFVPRIITYAKGQAYLAQLAMDIGKDGYLDALRKRSRKFEEMWEARHHRNATSDVVAGG